MKSSAKLYFTAFLFSLVLMSCGGGRPVILQPASGSVIPVSSSFNGGYAAPVITVVIENDDPNVQISFIPANIPGLQCIPAAARAYCYANSQGGSLYQETTLAIKAQNGDNYEYSIVTLKPGTAAR
ncbi:MAG: hypothetical protein KDD51_16870 [Bdellovibrionales bacterium]|nr:hypothetical protein [Bdellovibrionales bacterium]MCB0416556.1 hypothetical protein [Bdellovibrionales bacterium]